MRHLHPVRAGGSKYDPAGNMLSKTINGETTTFKYDGSNQLVSSTIGDKTTMYQYDAAGRLIQEGNKNYSYTFADKVLRTTEGDYCASNFANATEAGKNTQTQVAKSNPNTYYSYYASGQLATVADGEKSESFTWDGLALLRRDTTNYLNEPYVTGGNPVLADSKVLFN